MAEILLAVIVVALLVERHLRDRQHAAERRSLLNRLVAETPAELMALEREPSPRRRPRREQDADPPIQQIGV